MGEVTILPRQPRVVFEDDTLPHQIRLVFIRNKIAVSCTCMKKSNDGIRGVYKPIESRTRWEPGSDLAVWRAHVEAVTS